MPNYSYYGEELQDHTAAPPLIPDALNSENYTYCPWATTVAGWDANSESYVAVGVTCKRWGCVYCATRKVRRLAWMAKNAEPNRLLTLTHSDKEWAESEIDTPDGPRTISRGETCWRAASKAFPELIRFLRIEMGECEYLRVLELQANGMPHFHCMLRSGFLPQGKVLAEWRRLCGRSGVNLKKIDSSFRTFHYLVKYLTKLHKIEWTDRHVSYSREFFRREDREEVEYAKLEGLVKYDQHPWVWLRERYNATTISVAGEGRWYLPDAPDLPTWTIDPKTLGLPGEKPADPTPPKTQRIVPGMEAAESPADHSHLNTDGTRRKGKRK